MRYLNELPVFSHCRNRSTAPIFMAISKDYIGNSLIKDVYISLSIDQNNLYFSTRSELFSKPATIELGFEEGLWNTEASELFIYNSAGTDYQEFNISPSGAFWGMNFSSYRERATPIDDLHYMANGQTFSLRIPLKTINMGLDSETCLVQIAGVLKDVEDGKKILYSSSPLENTTPDFHRMESGLRLKIV